jgi:membrane associated rhomboid family serine protease
MACDMAEQKQSTERSSRDRGLLLLAAMAALMWVVEIVDAAAFDLDRHGIESRQLDGLDGIVFSPFLHGGFGHLIGNTVPFLLLGGAIALSGLARVAAVTAIVALVGGAGTWLSGPEDTVHIGASGVVFGYAAYLVTRFWWTRRALDLGVALLVVGLYGTTLLVGLVPTPGVSWQGHLFGAAGGLVAARVLDRRPAHRPAAAERDPLAALR